MDIKHLLTGIAFLVIVAILVHQKKKVVIPVAVAFIISLIWTTYYRYQYIGDNIFILNRINIYPLILWTLGLIILFLVDKYFKPEMKKTNRALLSVILYFIVLGVIEVIGYYLLEIRLSGNYTSLLGLGIIHAPLQMKIFYVTAGPIYLLLINTITTYTREKFRT